MPLTSKVVPSSVAELDEEVARLISENVLLLPAVQQFTENFRRRRLLEAMRDDLLKRECTVPVKRYSPTGRPMSEAALNDPWPRPDYAQNAEEKAKALVRSMSKNDAASLLDLLEALE